MICECGSKKYKIIEAAEESVYSAPGEITLQCVSCPRTYKCTGVYPLSIDFPGAKTIPNDQPFIEVELKMGGSKEEN